MQELNELSQNDYDALAASVNAWDHLTPEERKQVLHNAVGGCVAYHRQVQGRPIEPRPLEVSVTLWRPVRLAAS